MKFQKIEFQKINKTYHQKNSFILVKYSTYILILTKYPETKYLIHPLINTHRSHSPPAKRTLETLIPLMPLIKKSQVFLNTAIHILGRLHD